MTKLQPNIRVHLMGTPSINPPKRSVHQYPCTNTHTRAGIILCQACEASWTISIPVKVLRHCSMLSLNPAAMEQWTPLEDSEKWHAQKLWRMDQTHNSEFKSRGLWAERTRRMIFGRRLFQQQRAEVKLTAIHTQRREWMRDNLRGIKETTNEKEKPH